MKDRDLLNSISKRLGVLIALQLQNKSSEFSTTKGVELLTRFGLDTAEIAEILNTSSGTVSVIKNRIKKPKKK